VSVGVQVGLVGVLVAWPLIDPVRMPVVYAASVKTVSLPRPKVAIEPPKPKVVRVTNAEAPRAPSSGAASVVAKNMGAVISRPQVSSSDEPPLLPVGGGMAKDGALISSLGSRPASGAGPVVTLKPGGGAGDTVRLSSGVTNGMLLAPIRPEYPAIAKASHTEGTVVATATIDRNGRIVGLQVVSGPMMLRQAAAEAIREARYRPYLLNGLATEVETTISVSFRMSGE